ncbi:hypothetical protein TH53_20845 [Pedobacter lusitanus]|uniref:N-acetyltransferase domain-containing protein n=1 Tax=Pedobacter lusitanus TaxID=1503925 RepID=A0A0D0GH61_9SPHI|nr:hypothetical protein TH53_20845 [Pedobacter lusitanus]
MRYTPDQDLYDLLLLADPSIEIVNSYINNNQIYTAIYNTKTLGVFVLFPVNKKVIEIKNIAVRSAYQNMGLGKHLLKKATAVARDKGFERLRIATGNSSIGQLALYQKEGFELIGTTQNFFTDNYPEPIFENGIQCKHLLLLEKEL